jgi:hypothetical protein
MGKGGEGVERGAELGAGLEVVFADHEENSKLEIRNSK